MNGIVQTMRTHADAELSIAMLLHEVANRRARDEIDHEYDLWRLAQLQAQQVSRPTMPTLSTCNARGSYRLGRRSLEVIR